MTLVRRWLLGALAVCFVAVTTTMPARASLPAEVVVIGVPGLRWSDVDLDGDFAVTRADRNQRHDSVRAARGNRRRAHPGSLAADADRVSAKLGAQCRQDAPRERIRIA